MQNVRVEIALRNKSKGTKYYDVLVSSYYLILKTKDNKKMKKWKNQEQRCNGNGSKDNALSQREPVFV